MKVAALAIVCVLIGLPAEAGQRHRQNNVSPSCDNDGRCTTLNAAAPTSSMHQYAHQSVNRTTQSMPMATA